jgi:hypothetical protein
MSESFAKLPELGAKRQPMIVLSDLFLPERLRDSEPDSYSLPCGELRYLSEGLLVVVAPYAMDYEVPRHGCCEEIWQFSQQVVQFARRNASRFILFRPGEDKPEDFAGEFVEVGQVTTVTGRMKVIPGAGSAQKQLHGSNPFIIIDPTTAHVAREIIN